MKENYDDYLDYILEGKTKQELVNYINNMRDDLLKKSNNYSRLRNAKERGKFNPQFARSMNELKEEIGVYKRGSRKSEIRKASLGYSKEQLMNIARKERASIRIDVYSKKGREQKEETARVSYENFIKEGEYSPEYENRLDYSFEDYKKLTDIYNKLGEKLTKAFGSETVMTVYETMKESNVDMKPSYIKEIMENVVIEKYGGVLPDWKTTSNEKFVNDVFNAILDKLEELEEKNDD
jgi:hypothetical protein